MKNWTFFLLFSVLTFHVVAYPPAQSIESSLQTIQKGTYRDLEAFKSLYGDCLNPSEIISLHRELGGKLRTASTKSLNQIACALAFDSRGEHKKAVYQLRSLASNLSGQTAYVRGEYYCALAKISYTSENPKRAIELYTSGIRSLKKSKEMTAVQIAYTNLGLAYAALDQHETALAIYAKASSIQCASSQKIQLYLHLNQALSYTHLDKNTESKAAFKSALVLIQQTKDYFGEIRTYGNLADIYLAEDSLDMAEFYYLKGRRTAIRHNLKLDLIRLDHSLAQLYQKMGKHQKALFYFTSYDSIRNSVQLEQTAEAIGTLENENQLAIKKVEQAALNKTIRLKQQKNTILWVGIGLLGLMVILLLWQLRVIRKKNKVLLKKNVVEQTVTQLGNEVAVSTSMNEEQLAMIRAFESFLIDKKAYCKADLTQEKVAKKLGTNRTYLSKAINDHYSMSYSRWINELRIHESKKMLMDSNYAHFSIEGIAKSVGFSSLSAFNSNFKQITGLTPSYFKNNFASI